MFRKVINFLEERKIAYLILNGYEELIDGLNKSDTDVLLRKADFKIIESVLKEICIIEGWLFIQNYHHDVWAKNIFLINTNSLEILNLDLYGFLSRKNVPLFSEAALFQKPRLFEGLKILNISHEFVYYLSKRLDKEDLTDEVFHHLKTLFLNNPQECKTYLKNYFPRTYLLIEKAFLQNEIELLKNKKLIQDFSKGRKTSLEYKFKNTYRLIKRILKPTGFSIALLGPDGSGKSTIINLLKESHLPFRQTKYFHLKPKKHSHTRDQILNPHVKPIYSPLKSYFKLLYFIYQYNLGWVKNIIPLKIRSTLIIFDRYYDDLLVDTKRYRYGGRLYIARFIKKLIPQPNIYFVLTASPKLIYERKKEVEFEELERQIRSYRNLTNNCKYHAIEVSKLPKEITNEIISVIAQKMSEKYF